MVCPNSSSSSFTSLRNGAGASRSPRPPRRQPTCVQDHWRVAGHRYDVAGDRCDPHRPSFLYTASPNGIITRHLACALDGTSRQVDAAFALDDTLVIGKCRAVGRSLAVEKGDPQALDLRKRLIERTLTDIDEKATWLQTHQAGSNYAVGSYQWVLPVGVTPFKEFIHSRDSRFWIDEQLPRVLSPGELQKALEDGTLRAAAARSPNRVKLS